MFQTAGIYFLPLAYFQKLPLYPKRETENFANQTFSLNQHQKLRLI